MNQNNADLTELERRVEAERYANLAGVSEHPWKGAAKTLEAARAEQKQLEDKAAAASFAQAIENYRRLLSEERDLESLEAEKRRILDSTADGKVVIERLMYFFPSPRGMEWQLDRRQGRGSSIPPGFTAEDLERRDAHTAARAAFEEVIPPLNNVRTQLASLEEQYAVLRDLR